MIFRCAPKLAILDKTEKCIFIDEGTPAICRKSRRLPSRTRTLVEQFRHLIEAKLAKGERWLSTPCALERKIGNDELRACSAKLVKIPMQSRQFGCRPRGNPNQSIGVCRQSPPKLDKTLIDPSPVPIFALDVSRNAVVKPISPTA